MTVTCPKCKGSKHEVDHKATEASIGGLKMKACSLCCGSGEVVPSRARDCERELARAS